MPVWFCLWIKVLAAAGGSDQSAPAPPATFGHVEKVGTGSTVLLLVPCLGCDWRAWDEFMERNKELYTMYAVTWPGMGDTAMPDIGVREDETPLWDNAILAMKRLIKSKKLDGPILIGHSGAGPYAVDFAHRYPEFVSQIVTVDATITNWETYNFTRSQRFAWAKAEMEGVRKKYDNDKAWAKFNSPPKSLASPARSAMYGKMWITPPRENVLRYWREWLMTNAGVMLPELKVPLMAMYAVKPNHPDLNSARIQHKARLHRNAATDDTQAVFVHPSGHTIWEHQPEVFDRMIADFVAGLKVQSYWGQ